MQRRTLLSALAASAIVPTAARAETNQVSVAEQYGIAYLPLTVMRDQGLFEKRLTEAGLAPEIRWSVISGSTAMNDAVLSGGLDIASGAFANFIVVWNKTHGAVRAFAALPATPLYFVTIQPGLQRITDLGPGSHVAVPTVGVSAQAFLLQYVAAKAFGPAEYRRFDPLTVSMSHPDAVNALMGGRSEVNCHFSSPPFQSVELRNPAIRRIGSSYDIMGGAHTSSVVWGSTRFHDQNPRTSMAFLLAYRDASRLIQADPGLAAQAYLRQTKSRDTLADVTAQVADKEFDYGLMPMKLDRISGLLADTGRLASRPDIVRDLFFAELPQVAAG